MQVEGRRSPGAAAAESRGRAGSESRAGAPAGADGLEDLVRMVSALDAERATALLSGLAETLRPQALRLLACIERSSRADRHAALASAFVPRCTGRAPVDAIPGLLGAEVRNQLAPGAAPTAASGPEAMVRWSRRVALELERAPTMPGRAALPPGRRESGVTPAPGMRCGRRR